VDVPKAVFRIVDPETQLKLDAHIVEIRDPHDSAGSFNTPRLASAAPA
jgi:hypothetical protein